MRWRPTGCRHSSRNRSTTSRQPFRAFYSTFLRSRLLLQCCHSYRKPQHPPCHASWSRKMLDRVRRSSASVLISSAAPLRAATQVLGCRSMRCHAAMQSAPHLRQPGKRVGSPPVLCVLRGSDCGCAPRIPHRPPAASPRPSIERPAVPFHHW